MQVASRTLYLVSIVSLWCGISLAQYPQTQPGQTQPGQQPGQSQPGQTQPMSPSNAPTFPRAEAADATTGMPVSDKTFLKKAAEGNMTEVELGKLAEEKGSSPAVKEFGKR